MDKEEKIRSTINEMDESVLKDSMAILLASYNTSSIPQNQSKIKADYKNFAQAIMDLKKKYNFPELNFFTTEADLVYVQAGDRKILLTDKDTMYHPVRKNSETVNENINESSASKNNASSDLTSSEENPESFENAFENIKQNDTRFSHLEL